MDERTTTLHLARKRLSAVDIHADLVATLGPESVNSPSVTHYLRQAKFAISKPNIVLSEPELEVNDSDEAILLDLLPQRTTFDADYSIAQMITSLPQLHCERGQCSSQVRLHFENSLPHCTRGR
jgi:hypothetical protein